MARLNVLVLTAISIFAAVTVADESWIDQSDGLEIIYEEDLPNNTAVFLQEDGHSAKRIFIPAWNSGLPRGVHEAFWIDYSDEVVGCDEPIPDPMGYINAAYNWGHMVIEWDNEDYPSGFYALLGVCDGPLEQGFYAAPR